MSNQSDSFDHASEVEDAFREAAIAKACRTEPTPQEFDGENCTVCGLEIVPGRLALGKFRCVDCQGAIDLGRKLYGKGYCGRY